MKKDFIRVPFKKRFIYAIEKILLRHGVVFAATDNSRKKELDLSDSLDYIRYATLESAAREINTKKIAGNIAEVGVYQGRFASKMNLLFPDRKFYLFDTFTGFDDKDIEIEKAKGIPSSDEDKKSWRDTSETFVLSRMSNPQNCIVKKGYFPETARGIEEEKFAFVSLDADLWNPTYEGLEFFYPKLMKGGYIFVHDCNALNAGGALRKFSQENNVPYVALPDSCGTAVVVK